METQQPLKVKDILSLKDKEGQVGIEIEVESEPGYVPVQFKNTWWTTKEDHSLRNGAEYVTVSPLPVNEHKLARIQKLIAAVDTPLAKLAKKTHRTSVHVHNNVLDFTPVQVWTAVTCYWLLELLFFSQFDKERQGNGFCLRLKDAEAILKIAETDIKNSRNPFATVASDSIRYAGGNLAAIGKFGSFETRGLEGTLDPQKIDVWSTTTYTVLDRARKYFKSPQEVLDFYFFKGWKALVYRLVPDPMKTTILAIPRGEDLVEEHAWLMTNFCYCADWTEYAKRIETNFPRAQKKSGKPAMTLNPAPMDWNVQEQVWQTMQAPQPTLTPEEISIMTGAVNRVAAPPIRARARRFTDLI